MARKAPWKAEITIEFRNKSLFELEAFLLLLAIQVFLKNEQPQPDKHLKCKCPKNAEKRTSVQKMAKSGQLYKNYLKLYNCTKMPENYTTAGSIQ